jgi:Ran GTPase-activating protein (RanGAP) involved in mRNA processing and transport
LRELDLSWNTLGLLEEGVSYIASALASNNYLETLILTNCQLGHDAGRALAGGVTGNTGLRLLDMRWNNLGDVGASALARALEYNTTLQHLKLEGNHASLEVLQVVEARTAANRTAASGR